MKFAAAILALLLASCASKRDVPDRVHPEKSPIGGPAPTSLPDPARGGHVECDGDSCRFVPDAPKVAPTNEGTPSVPFALPDPEPARRERDPAVPRGPEHSIPKQAEVATAVPQSEAPRLTHDPVSPAPIDHAAPPESTPVCQPRKAPWYCSAEFGFCVLVATILVAAFFIVRFNRRS